MLLNEFFKGTRHHNIQSDNWSTTLLRICLLNCCLFKIAKRETDIKCIAASIHTPTKSHMHTPTHPKFMCAHARTLTHKQAPVYTHMHLSAQLQARAHTCPKCLCHEPLRLGAVGLILGSFGLIPCGRVFLDNIINTM